MHCVACSREIAAGLCSWKAGTVHQLAVKRRAPQLLPPHRLLALQPASPAWGHKPCFPLLASLAPVRPRLKICLILFWVQTDPAWPGPCYGAVPPQPLAPEAAAAVVAMLQEAFAQVEI